MPLETQSLKLVPKTPEEVWADIGFSLVLRTTGDVVGSCGFKGPPDAEGAVEIAYGLAPDHQGKGYATEAAMALVDFAMASGSVGLVRAHTIEQANASTRVLTRCGFHPVGTVMDPEDGLVWRWEKYLRKTR